MDTEKCHALLSVLKTKSITKAASLLGYTPSGISRMISTLEDETGFPLINRSRKGITATKACEELLPIIKVLDEQSNQYRILSNRILGMETGTFTVGTAYTALYPWLSRLINNFSQKHPGITINLLEGISTELSIAIENENLDFCIMSERFGNHDWIPIFEDELIALIPQKHPLAGCARFPLDRFSLDPFIEIYPHKETDNSRFFDQHGITPNVRYSTMDSFAACAMVEAGLGITLVNSAIAGILDGKVVKKAIEPPLMTTIGIATSRKNQQSPAVKKFIKYALEELDELKTMF